ncbi:hypothetical protein A2115_02205 [Candidatus Woesebacteria bacterium GWA1_41_8]|uniref:Uncharacterized protein n=1 Tax=Candidatus Woesebacteria bacterium GWA1_41_8 TaxID=1802471 RepID=A0A1F7WKX0_9BACT|nr:MAG: hypothetical protein A2115_02205 [Candidatus Woesebacteria bacterium GWA1_41_8]
MSKHRSSSRTRFSCLFDELPLRKFSRLINQKIKQGGTTFSKRSLQVSEFFVVQRFARAFYFTKRPYPKIERR